MFEEERRRMVEEQILIRGVREPRLLKALEMVPRHLFVRKAERDYDYDDIPLPIGHGQTISQPYIVALMTDLLKLTGDERVLDVGTGSGYQAAVLACMAGEVHTIEFIPELATRAGQLLSAYSNVTCHIGDGSLGWTAASPYMGIIVGAAAPKVPPALLEQLDEGGHLVIPIGAPGYQILEEWIRHGKRLDHRSISGVAFVPLRGAHGW